jgi:PAS domain S-box-containing protein
MKILIVEDDEGVCELIRESLAPLKYQLSFAHSGSSAVHSALHSPPDLILLDYSLPDMSGKEVITQINHTPDHDPIGFIVTTGQGDEHIAVEMMKLGALDYLVKNTNFLELLPKTVSSSVREWQTQQEMARQKALLEGVINGITDIIAIKNPQLGVIMYNRAGYELFGLQPEDLDGRTCSELLGLNEMCYAELTSLRALKTGKMVSEEHFFEPLGRRFDCRSIPLRDQNGAIFMLIEQLRDITEAHALQKQIKQMEKMTAIGQLAGGIAHDFNNQLAAITGFTQLLKQKTSLPEHQKLLDRILTCATHSADLTSKLLAFSHQGRYQVSTVDIHQIIDEVIDIIERTIDKRISISRMLNATPSETEGDVGQLQNALLNLAINARDAMEEGGTLTFQTSAEHFSQSPPLYNNALLPPGNYLRISIMDTGCGIPEAHLDRIFDPFFTAKPIGKGTGMGLPAVFGTISNHGGGLHVDSMPEKGTEITLYLPLAPPSDRSVQPQTNPLQRDHCQEELTVKDLQDTCTQQKSVSADSPASLTSPATPDSTATPASPDTPASHTSPASPATTLLIVEDEPMLREMLTESLELSGYQVRTACDGEEALLDYRTHWREIDMVILDLMMPKMSGSELLKSLKEIHPKVKTLLISGYTPTSSSGDDVMDGDCHFLQKPFDLATFENRVSTILKNF